MGDHGGALDRLRALNRSRRPFDELLALYWAWTGEEEWLRRLAPDWRSGPPPSFEEDWRLATRDSGPPISDSHPSTLDRASEIVRDAIHGTWGVRPDSPAETVAIRPALPLSWPTIALRQLRVGHTVADFVLRRTRNGLGLSVSRVRGPAIRVLLTCEGVDVFEVDGVELSGGRAVFRLEQEHQVTIRA